MNKMIGGYSAGHLYAELTREEIKKLDDEKRLEGIVYRAVDNSTLSLIILVKEGIQRVWASGMPQNKTYEEKEWYEIHLPREAIKFLKQGKSVGSELNRLRKVVVFPAEF